MRAPALESLNSVALDVGATTRARARLSLQFATKRAGLLLCIELEDSDTEHTSSRPRYGLKDIIICISQCYNTRLSCYIVRRGSAKFGRDLCA